MVDELTGRVALVTGASGGIGAAIAERLAGAGAGVAIGYRGGSWTRPVPGMLRPVPGMRERGWGRILLMSSVAALTGGLVGPHYAASKAGLHGLLHFVAAREAGHGITVNALAPPLIEETAMLPGDPGDLAARIPVGRLGRPAEVADLALAVLANGYTTSQVIGLDGGMHPR